MARCSVHGGRFRTDTRDDDRSKRCELGGGRRARVLMALTVMADHLAVHRWARCRSRDDARAKHWIRTSVK
jgi:hypothetical protein